MCAAAQVVHLELAEIATFEFADYSCPCVCGDRLCSECAYTSDGETITVHHCGRFKGVGYG